MSEVISKYAKGATIGIIIAAILSSVLIFAIISVAYSLIQGDGLESITGFLNNLDDVSGRNKTRVFLMLNHLFTFIIPAILIAIILTSKQAKEYLSLHKPPKLINIGLGALLIILAYPFIQKSYEWNAMLPLPEWMLAMETDTNESLKGLLTMKHFGEFALNIFVISVIPGIGEELLFRGVIQKEAYRWTRPGVAVWIAAILFSAMHMQFQGFFPRLLLGASLGYLYLFTKNLWIPIVIHFLNNALPIVSMYFFDTDLADLSPEDSPKIPLILAIASLLLTIALGLYIQKRNNETAYEPPPIP